MSLLSAIAPGNQKIVSAAQRTWAASRGNPYKWGGHTPNGFDCSGFVCYVMRQVAPSIFQTPMTARALFDSNLFMTVDQPPQLGDLICFQKGSDLSHDHVGIVYDIAHWIGSQKSTGVQTVLIQDLFWSKKPRFFRRYIGPLS